MRILEPAAVRSQPVSRVLSCATASGPWVVFFSSPASHSNRAVLPSGVASSVFSSASEYAGCHSGRQYCTVGVACRTAEEYDPWAGRRGATEHSADRLRTDSGGLKNTH